MNPQKKTSKAMKFFALVPKAIAIKNIVNALNPAKNALLNVVV